MYNTDRDVYILKIPLCKPQTCIFFQTLAILLVVQENPGLSLLTNLISTLCKSPHTIGLRTTHGERPSGVVPVAAYQVVLK